MRPSQSSEAATSVTVGLGAEPGSARVEGCPPVEQLPPGLHQELVTEARRRRLPRAGRRRFRGAAGRKSVAHPLRALHEVAGMEGRERRSVARREP